MSKRETSLAIMSALVAPGIGRALVSNVWAGMGLYVLFVLLWWLPMTGPYFNLFIGVTIPLGVWPSILIRLTIWAGFVFIDMSKVMRATRERSTTTNLSNTRLWLSTLGYLSILVGLCSALMIIGLPLLSYLPDLAFMVGWTRQRPCIMATVYATPSYLLGLVFAIGVLVIPVGDRLLRVGNGRRG